MISKFKQTLRIAALEDLLRHQLGLRPNTATWMARLAWDVAAENNVDLMAYRGNALLSQALELIEGSEHRSALHSGPSAALSDFQALQREIVITGLQRAA
jgi:hypothetical protein